jgi:HAMP domain-containing protein
MNETPRRRSVFISLPVKLLIAFSLLFSVIFAGAFYWFYNYSTNSATQRVVEDLDTLLAGTVGRINGDDFEALVKDGTIRDDGFTDDQRFWDQVTWLNTARHIDPRSGIYTLSVDPATSNVVYVGSSGALDDPPTGVKFKEDCGDCPNTLQVMATGETLHILEPYTDEFGSWISGYVPIRNSADKVVGVLGIDYLASYVVTIQDGIKNNLVLVFTLTYVVLFITVWLVSRIVTNPVRALTRIASRIGEGDYNQDLTFLSHTRIRDEISSLARVFDVMIDKIQAREVKLKERVAALEIIVDQGKRDAQVSEIVDSDFFQDLQSKAKDMRQRKNRPQGADVLASIETKDSTDDKK